MAMKNMLRVKMQNNIFMQNEKLSQNHASWPNIVTLPWLNDPS
jgi:hypothetical protein